MGRIFPHLSCRCGLFPANCQPADPWRCGLARLGGTADCCLFGYGRGVYPLHCRKWCLAGQHAETRRTVYGTHQGRVQQITFFWLLALRLVPAFPFWVVNIVPALLGMGARPFLIATLVGITPGSAAYIWVGISLQPILAAGRVPNSTDLTRPELLASLAVLAGLAVIPALWRSMKSKGQKKHGR